MEATRTDGAPEGAELTRTGLPKEPESPRRIVERAALGEVKGDEDEAIEDAAAWLLEAASGDVELLHDLKINVGSRSRPRMIRWTIRAVPGPTIRKLREAAAGGNRSMRRSGFGSMPDANQLFEANVKLVVMGTAYPDVATLAADNGMKVADFLLEKAFRRKQGLIDQIAAEIMDLSGYDDEDVQDAMVQGASGS